METINAIIREMRDEVRTSRENNPDPRTRVFLTSANMALEDFADRLEAAYTREIIVERNLSNNHILSLHDEIAAKDEEIERCREELRATRDRRDVCETKMRTALERVTRAESKCDSLRELVKELADALEAEFKSTCEISKKLETVFDHDALAERVIDGRELISKAREEVKDA